MCVEGGISYSSLPSFVIILLAGVEGQLGGYLGVQDCEIHFFSLTVMFWDTHFSDMTQFDSMKALI